MLFALYLATLTPAFGCGGFVCNPSAPVIQTGESVIFGVHNGRITAHVEVNYEGPAEEFGWIVPVPEQPSLMISTPALFQRLRQVTTPNLSVGVSTGPECLFPIGGTGSGGGGNTGGIGGTGAAFAGTGDTGGGHQGVVVVEQRQVGPYDSVVLTAETTDQLLTWLADNGYDLPTELLSTLDPYVATGSYFVALKLSKNRDVGDLTPISFSYAGTEPSVPLQLTSVAADADMPIRVYVFGEHRAVPQSYLHVELNPAVLDHSYVYSAGSFFSTLSQGSYDEAVTIAANEAGGHAFVTDTSMSTEGLASLFPESVASLRETLKSASNQAEAVQMIMNTGLRSDTQLTPVLQALLPIPDSLNQVQPSWVYNCMNCYPDMMAQPFDPLAFAVGFDELMLCPRESADILMSASSRVTRLSTIISPEEMTVDPTFVFNADMEQSVGTSRSASVLIDCDVGEYASSARAVMTLSDDREVKLLPDFQGSAWNQMADLRNVYALKIQQTGPTGLPVDLFDYTPSLAAELQAHNDLVDGTPRYAEEDVYPDAEEETPRRSACGCASTTGTGGSFVGMFGLLLLWRRRQPAG